MTGLLRISLLLIFALFWGGLTFYTGFVVRISHDVLSDPMDGGLITQRVTSLLQILGVVMVVLMICNAAIVARKSRRFGNALFACATIVACSLIGLFVVHYQLDAVINIDAAEITNREKFDAGHRRYNQLTTIEWLATLAYLPITVLGWRAVDSQAND